MAQHIAERLKRRVETVPKIRSGRSTSSITSPAISVRNPTNPFDLPGPLSGYTADGTSQQYAIGKVAHVAPVLCAGIAVYKGLSQKKSGPRAGQTVAIDGAGGGLGSLLVRRKDNMSRVAGRRGVFCDIAEPGDLAKGYEGGGDGDGSWARVSMRCSPGGGGEREKPFLQQVAR
ncbi:MAG: hypothetical protein L6R35_004959, partial [Caloplaca aegaea]